MTEISRYIGDYHEYCTVEELGERLDCDIVNLPRGKEHGNLLESYQRDAIDIASKQCANIIIEHLDVKFKDKSVKKIVAIGNSSGAGNSDSVDDIHIYVDSDSKPSFVVSLKFTSNSKFTFTKNMGIGTIFSDYFNSVEFQSELDIFYEENRLKFLNSVLETSLKNKKLMNYKDASILCKSLDPKLVRFSTKKVKNNVAFSSRNVLLRDTRDFILDKLGKVHPRNLRIGALKIAGMSPGVDLRLTSVAANNNVTTRIESELDVIGSYTLKKSGNDRINISYSNVIVGIRAKFEGGRILSTMKFAGSKEEI